MSDRIPLFPLRTVLFPAGELSLRIFEARYLEMVSRCLRDDMPFGICLIRSGSEVGPGADFARTGTSARILDWERRPDGLLGIVARGERRFSVRASATDDSGLHWGDVDWRDDAAAPSDAAAQRLCSLLRRVAAAEGWGGALTPERLGDIAWVSYRIAERVPDTGLQQWLLEMDAVADRVRSLAGVLLEADSPA
jgi:hypothetical protein